MKGQGLPGAAFTRGEQMASITPASNATKWDAVRAITAHLKRETQTGRVGDVDTRAAAELLAVLDIDPKQLRRKPEPPRSAAPPPVRSRRASAIDVDCPDCGVKAGHRCVTRNDTFAVNAHESRKRTARESRNVAATGEVTEGEPS